MFIDEKILPLIDYLNQSGVTTTYCCQGNPEGHPDRRRNDAYIAFASIQGMLHAVELLADLAMAAGEHDLAANILGSHNGPGGILADREEMLLPATHWQLTVAYHAKRPRSVNPGTVTELVDSVTGRIGCTYEALQQVIELIP